MKSKTTAALLAFFLGGFGVHRFYLGQPILGIIYLLFCWTFIPVIIGLIDFIILLTYSNEKFHKKYNKKSKSLKTENDVQENNFKPTVSELEFPDRIDTIIWHINAIEKGFKNKDLDLVNLSYAKLIESIRQQNVNENDIYTDHFESVRNEYKEFRDTYNYEYPQQFLPPSERKKASASNSNGQFLVNPNSNFKLHLFNAPDKVLKQVQKTLMDENTWNKENDLIPLFTAYNVKCHEIENYISKYKPQYHEFIENAKASSSEYKEASEMDKLDIENEMKEEAINSLYERAACELDILFEGSEIPETIDDALIEEYGFETISKYIGLSYYKDKIITHWERKEFEDLLKADLAISGNEIPYEEILFSQTLKTLNKIAEQEENYFKRKQKAIDYLTENPKLLENIGKHVSTRSIFKIKPLPKKFENIDLDKLSASWSYIKEYIKLLSDTYRDSQRSTEDIKGDKSWIKEFRVEKHEDYVPDFICQRARKECDKKYNKNRPPKLPFHVGCNCDLRTEI